MRLFIVAHLLLCVLYYGLLQLLSIIFLLLDIFALQTLKPLSGIFLLLVSPSLLDVYTQTILVSHVAFMYLELQRFLEQIAEIELMLALQFYCFPYIYQTNKPSD